VNPIRRNVEMMKIDPNPAKNLIPLTIGDPTIHCNYKAPDHIIGHISKVQAFSTPVEDMPAF
jgi:hypothetical protein